MRNLDMGQLRTLVTIAQHSNFSSAASKLFRTQSAITQQMKSLELMVGVPLFEKQGRNKILTEGGKNLVQYAIHVLAINDEALRVFTKGELQGTISLGSPHDVAETILPSILKHIHRVLPQIKMNISIERVPKLMESLYAGQIDFTISSRLDPELEGVILRTSPGTWLCAADFVYNPRKPVPLVLVDESSIYRQMAITTLDQARIPWVISHIAPNLVGIRAAVRAGIGITPRTMDLLSPEMRALGESDGLPALPDITYYLWLRHNLVNKLARHVYDTLKHSWNLADPKY